MARSANVLRRMAGSARVCSNPIGEPPMTVTARQSRSAPREMILIEHLPFETDRRLGERARIGLIVLSCGFTLGHERRAIFAALPGVALYDSRLYNNPIITPESLRAMDPLIAPAASLILPGNPLDAIAFGCTSASMAIGEDGVFARIREGGQEA